MPIVNSPPPAYHLVKGTAASCRVPSLDPRLFRANEVHHVDARLEVAVRGDVLVVGRRGDVVGKRDAVVRMPEVHVDETLICAVKRDSSLCHSHHRIVVTHVWSQNHDTRVEQVRPSYVRGS